MDRIAELLKTDRMNDVGLRCESNWEQVEGSLEDCIVFRSGIHGEGGGRGGGCGTERKRLVLAPGEENCAPCQITIKFMQRQCKVHSIYIQSTAEVYELYTMSDLVGEKEYVCTVHGEIAMGNYDPNHRGGNISQSQICPLGSISSWGADGSQLLKKEQGHYKGLVDRQDLEGKMHNDQSLHKLFQKNITRCESQSSDEESWVQVKFSSSLEMLSSCEPRGVSGLQTLNNSKHVKDTWNQKSEKSANVDHWKIQKHAFHEPASTKNLYFDVHAREEKMGTVAIGQSRLLEEDQVAESKNNDNSIHAPSTKNIRPGKKLYEGTVEIVNAKPCISLTMQFPLIQEKCCLKVEEIRIHASPAIGVMDEIKIRDFRDPFGNSLGGSLLAMLGSSIFDRSRNGWIQEQDAFFLNPFHGSQESELSEFSCSEESESSDSGCSLSEYSSSCPSLINIPALLERSATLEEQYASYLYGMNSGETCSSDFLLYETTTPYSVLSPGVYQDDADENIGKFETNFRGNLGSFSYSNYDIEEPCGKAWKGRLQSGFSKSDGIDRVNEYMAHDAEENIGKFETNFRGNLGSFSYSNYDIEEPCRKAWKGGLQSGFSKSDGIERVNEYMAHGQMEPEVGCSAKSSTRKVKCRDTKEACTGSDEEYHGPIMQQLFEHIDRLETMCARIEVKLLTTLDKMERRIELLESRHVQTDQSHVTGMDQKTPHAGINSPPDCFPSPSTSEMPKDQRRQESLWGVTSQSLSKIPLAPTSDISLVSIIDSSSSIITSSPSSPSPCHDLNNKPSFPDKSMNSVPPHSSALLSFKECSKPIYTGSSSGVFLNESAFASLNHWGISNRVEDFLPNFSNNNLHATKCTYEAITTSAGYSHPSAYGHTITNIKNLSRVEEAIASALAAFSASTHEEETSSCTETSCSTSKGNMENDDTYYDDIHYDDYVNFCLSEEVRFRTQEGMESVPYGSSSQQNWDLKSTQNRGKFVNVWESCKPDMDTTIKFHKEVASFECKNEARQLKSRTNSAEMKHGPRDGRPYMATFERDCQKQYSPSEHCISSKQNTKDFNLAGSEIANERTVCVSCNGFPQRPEHRLPRIKTKLSRPKEELRHGSTTIESDNAREIQDDAAAAHNMHFSPFSLSHVASRTYDTCQATQPLEAPLCNHDQPAGRAVGLQICTETKPSVKRPALKRPHFLFFIEDEGLGDFNLPTTSNSPCTVSVNNCNVSEGMKVETSQGCESLPW